MDPRQDPAPEKDHQEPAPPPKGGFAFAPKRDKPAKEAPSPPQDSPAFRQLSIKDLGNREEFANISVRKPSDGSFSSEPVEPPANPPAGPPSPAQQAYPPPVYPYQQPSQTAEITSPEATAPYEQAAYSAPAEGSDSSVPPAFAENPPQEEWLEINEVYDDDLPPPQDNIPIQAVLGAAGVAVLGAIIWSLIIFVTHWEIGLLAWGVGAGVGAAASFLRGRGFKMGLIAGVLAFAAIFGGRYLGIAIIVEDLVRDAAENDPELLQTFLIPDLYEQMMYEAEQFSEVESDGDWRHFLWENGYSAAEEEWQITDEELTDAKSDSSFDILTEMAEVQPTYNEWIDMMTEDFVGVMVDVPVWAYFTSSFGILDIIFIFLGVGTAFKLASAQDGDM